MRHPILDALLGWLSEHRTRKQRLWGIQLFVCAGCLCLFGWISVAVSYALAALWVSEEQQGMLCLTNRYTHNCHKCTLCVGDSTLFSFSSCLRLRLIQSSVFLIRENPVLVFSHCKTSQGVFKTHPWLHSETEKMLYKEDKLTALWLSDFEKETKQLWTI